MLELLRRLERGERSWAAEIGFRIFGAGSLAFCGLAGRWLCQAVNRQPGQASCLAELTAALATVVAWFVGLAFLAEGPGLLRLMPIPPRPIYNRFR